MKNPPTVPTSGTVTYKDKPLSNAKVIFSPNDPGKGRPAEAMTKSDGSYQLSTFEAGDGAMAGEYKIAVLAVETPSDPGTKNADAKSVIPAKYTKPATSGLTATIAAGDKTKTVPIDIKD